MIRKISSGRYRLYSRKKNPQTDAGGTSEPFDLARQLKLTSERSNISKDTERVFDKHSEIANSEIRRHP